MQEGAQFDPPTELATPPLPQNEASPHSYYNNKSGRKSRMSTNINVIFGYYYYMILSAA